MPFKAQLRTLSTFDLNFDFWLRRDSLKISYEHRLNEYVDGKSLS